MKTVTAMVLGYGGAKSIVDKAAKFSLIIIKLRKQLLVAKRQRHLFEASACFFVHPTPLIILYFLPQRSVHNI